MAHGMADYGVYAAKKTTFNLADMADLAVRLGSIVEYDRRGDVIFIDDYESPVKRFYVEDSPGCSIILDSEHVYSKAQCAKIITAGVLNDYIQATYYISPLATGRQGAKIALGPYEMDSFNSKYSIGGLIYDGTYKHSFALELNAHDKTLKYEPPVGAEVTFETSFKMFGRDPYIFHNIKVVIDLDTGKYVRFLFNNLSWDMSAYSYEKVLDGTHPYVYLALAFTDLEGHVFNIRQDNFVYTINEP